MAKFEFDTDFQFEIVPDEPASTGGKEHERIETKNNGSPTSINSMWRNPRWCASSNAFQTASTPGYWSAYVFLIPPENQRYASSPE